MSVAVYPEYKDSEVEGLGRVPSHWTLKRLRFAAMLNPTKSEIAHLDRDTELSFLPMDAVGEDGSLRLDELRPVGAVETGYTFFREGDVAFAKITPCFENGKGAIMRGLVGGYGFGTTELTVLRPVPGVASAEFLNWIICSPQFRAFGEGSMYGAGGQKRVPDDFARDFVAGFPSVPEQTAIASFLDRETGKIDALVEEQRRLIALLKEKRHAVISHAVTKGLDPNTPIKDSGVEWLGEVPAHWEVKRFKHLINSIEQGWSPQCEASPAETENDWAVLKVGCVNGGLFNPEENKTFPPELTPIESLGISEGDLLISRANTRELVGSTAVATKAYPRLMLCDKLYRLRFQSMMMLPQFASFYLATPGARGQIEVAATGASSSMVNIGQSTILEMEIAVPPLAEQGGICLAAMAQGGEFRRLVDAAETAIALLAERRAALISAAVTGKIDVRGFAQPEAVAA